MKGTPWTPAETEYLRANYGKVPVTVIAAHLGRSDAQVRGKGKHMGLAGLRDCEYSKRQKVRKKMPTMVRDWLIEG